VEGSRVVAKRYTAIVEIVEIEETAEVRGSYHGSNGKPASKESKELAKFVVRDESLEALKVKLGKHVELV
jgi:hypothetical protein